MSPIYTYRCPKCKTTKEEMHGVNEEPDVYCMDCDDKWTLMERILSMTAPPVIGGPSSTAGKLRGGVSIKKRNDEYNKSPKGRAEHRANVAAAYKRLGSK